MAGKLITLYDWEPVKRLISTTHGPMPWMEWLKAEQDRIEAGPQTTRLETGGPTRNKVARLKVTRHPDTFVDGVPPWFPKG